MKKENDSKDIPELESGDKMTVTVKGTIAADKKTKASKTNPGTEGTPGAKKSGEELAKLETSGKSFSLDEELEWSLLSNRTVLFHGSVGQSTSKRATKKLEFLASKSKEPITIVLNSVGGDVYDGLLLYDTIKNLVTNGIPIVCEARGLAASMGAVLLQAGSVRRATPHTRFLIHEVSTFQWGKTSDIEDQTVELKKVNDMLKEILAERSGKTPQDIEDIWHKTDVWMSAEEAKEFGLVDEVISETPAFLSEALEASYEEMPLPAIIEKFKLPVGNEAILLDGPMEKAQKVMDELEIEKKAEDAAKDATEVDTKALLATLVEDVESLKAAKQFLDLQPQLLTRIKGMEDDLVEAEATIRVQREQLQKAEKIFSELMEECKDLVSRKNVLEVLNPGDIRKIGHFTGSVLQERARQYRSLVEAIPPVDFSGVFELFNIEESSK